MDRPPNESESSAEGDASSDELTVDRELADAERAATHRTTEDIAPGVIKDGHGEIQPDPYPDRPERGAQDGPDREVLSKHRADVEELEHHRTGAANETLGTTVDQDELLDQRAPSRRREPSADE